MQTAVDKQESHMIFRRVVETMRFACRLRDIDNNLTRLSRKREGEYVRCVRLVTMLSVEGARTRITDQDDRQCVRCAEYSFTDHTKITRVPGVLCRV